MSTETNKERVRSFWQRALRPRLGGDRRVLRRRQPVHRRAFAGRRCGPGPDQIVARLRLGLERISAYEHDLRLVVAEGDAVVTEHTETWHWHTGEQVTLPFVSVQELRDGVHRPVVGLLGHADADECRPDWWIEHVAQGYT